MLTTEAGAEGEGGGQVVREIADRDWRKRNKWHRLKNGDIS